MNFTKKHRCYRSEDRHNKSENPILIHFDSINNFCHVVKKDEDNLYCANKFCIPYDYCTEMNIKGDIYTVYDIYDFDIKDDNAPTSIFEDSENDLYFYAKDKRDISIYKVFKSIDRKEIYIIPFGGCSLEGDGIINMLINVEILKQKYV